MKVYYYTLGCKVNQYETEALCELLKNDGAETVSSPNAADVCIINSCTVTAESDRKTRQQVRKIRLSAPNAVVLLMGCMPQAYPDVENVLPEADIITGNTSHAEIPELIKTFLQTGNRIVKILPHTEKERYNTPTISSFEERTRAYIKIEDGCDRYCSYCIIPKARGTVRSKSVEQIYTEAESLSKQGYKEVVLVGINLTSFGKDSGENIADAVLAAARHKGIKRVRLGSIEPDLIDDKTLLRLSEIEEFCPQFHLALQSGSDSVLKRMNRHYDTAFFYDLVERIRKIFKNASFTTDIMVGFATETEDEHGQSMEFVKKVGFAKCHVFAYSKRSGTVAAAIKCSLTNADKQRRSREMQKVCLETEHGFLDKCIGNTDTVLIESSFDGYAYGYTPNYCRVAIKTDAQLHSEIVGVKIISRQKETLIAEIVEK